MKSDIFKLIASIAICQLADVLASFFSAPVISAWYKTLHKPFFTPPDWIFAPVWSALYTLMGISLFLIWRRHEHPRFRIALAFFLVQLIFNILWSAAFFGLGSPLLGLIDIGLLWVAILRTIRYLGGISNTAGLPLLPYLLWVSLAVVLNFALWILNT